MRLTIDDKLHANLPTLTETEYQGLEQKILTEGFRDSIVTWAGTDIILDGRNRYNICQQHNITFTTGIDWIAKDEDDHIYGIASRIRHITPRCKEAYPEFTIRYNAPSGNKTEYAKRLEAIAKGYICPAITTQTWYSGSTFICGATIPTKELYNFVEMNEYRLQVQTAPDGKQFLCIPWNALKKANLNVTVVTGSN
jgi:hypothetical protein